MCFSRRQCKTYTLLKPETKGIKGLYFFISIGLERLMFPKCLESDAPTCLGRELLDCVVLIEVIEEGDVLLVRGGPTAGAVASLVLLVFCEQP